MLASEDVSTKKLDEFDLILTTIPLTHKCHRPVIQINEVFNEQELRRKIEKDHTDPQYLFTEVGVGYRMATEED